MKLVEMRRIAEACVTNFETGAWTICDDRFVSTFSPPRVLKMLQVIEAAKEIDKWMAKYGTAPCSISEAERLHTALSALEADDE